MNLIFFQLVSNILGYLRFIFSYGVHIIASAPKTSISIFVLEVSVPLVDKQTTLALQKPHKPCYTHFRWNLYQHMYMIWTYFRFHYGYSFPFT